MLYIQKQSLKGKSVNGPRSWIRDRVNISGILQEDLAFILEIQTVEKVVLS